MIELRQVTFEYSPASQIFDSFSWSILEGESWAVLGPSGCGKTTLFYLLAGLRFPSSGELHIHGERLEKPRPKTGLILQDYGLLPWATVRDNITLGLRIRKFYGPDGKHAPTDEEVAEISQSGAYWMDQLGLQEVADQFPEQISGGQRQRTAIARTLAIQPDLLLMDEPFSSLDAPTREGLQRFILQLRAEKKITNVIVTHSIEEAAFLGSKILILKGIPNQTPAVIDNPTAGKPDFLDTDVYNAMCRLLRLELER